MHKYVRHKEKGIEIKTQKWIILSRLENAEKSIASQPLHTK